MLLSLAWRNIWRNSRRTSITAASIFFAVLLTIVLSSIQEGAYQKMIENVVSFHLGYIQIHQKGYWDDQTLENTFEGSDSLDHILAVHPLIEEITPRLESFALASSESLSKPSMVVGTDPEKEHQLTLLKDKLVEGSYFQEGNHEGALVAEDLAQSLALGVGDSIILLGQGYRGVTAAGIYPIIGILHFGSPELNRRMVYLHISESQALYGTGDRYTSYVLDITYPSQATPITDQLTELMPRGYEVMDWKSMTPELVQAIEVDRGSNIFIIGILYLIVAFGMFGTLLMMLNERSYEFGVLIAIGMRPMKIVLMTFLEIFFISCLGILAGMMVAFPIVYYFHIYPISLGEEVQEAYDNFGIEAVFPAVMRDDIFLNQSIIIWLLVIVMSFYAMYHILKLKPIEAMKA